MVDDDILNDPWHDISDTVVQQVPSLVGEAIVMIVSFVDEEYKVWKDVVST